jgi:D-alanyl-D-alanine dipeptidase
MVPEHFISLQNLGFICSNYYFGSGGEKINITKEDLAKFGLTDDTLWIHPKVIPKLNIIREGFKSKYGLDFVINDAWRPSALYDLIADRRHEKDRREGNEDSVEKFFNLKDKPHSTGMAVDVLPVDPTTGEVLRTRNQARDGDVSCLAGYYDARYDSPESREYCRLQNIMFSLFLDNGFVLGTKREYWHFELPENRRAPKY